MIPALIGLAGTLAGVIGNAVAQRKANQANIGLARMSNSAQERLQGQQNAFNYGMWRLNNEYNSPANQASRLRAAGLSDAAIAQSVSGVPASPVSQATLPTTTTPEVSPLNLSGLEMLGSNIVSVMRGYQAYRKEKSEANISEIEEQYKEQNIWTDLQAREWNVKHLKQDFEQSAEKHPYHVRALQWDIKNNKINYKRLQVAYDEAKLNYQRAEYELGFIKQMNEKQFEKIDEEIKNLVEQRNQILQAIEESKARASESRAHANLMGVQSESERYDLENLKPEQKRLLQEDTFAKELSNILVSNGSPESVAERVGVLVANNIIPANHVSDNFRQTKQYFLRGYKEFNGTYEWNAFMDNVVNPGTAKLNSLGLHTIGAVHTPISNINR